MPGLMDVLGAALGGNAQQQLSQQIGATPQQTGSAIQAALPMLLAGLHLNASQPGGASALLGALENHDGSILQNVGAAIGGQLKGPAGDGAGIVNHVLGDQQDAAHQAVAQASGIGTAQASQLMTMLAPIVMGALAHVQQTQGLNAAGLAGMLKQEHTDASQAQPGLMSMATQLLGGNANADSMMKEIGGLFGKS